MKENAQKIDEQIVELSVCGNQVSALLSDLATNGEWRDGVATSYTAYTQSLVGKLKELKDIAERCKQSADKIDQNKIDDFKCSLSLLSSELERI